jgi:polysaccharide pyruvyl transferase WcaK-like protein
MERISVYESSYVTDNLGDQIIMESVFKHLRDIFPNGFFTGVPTHDYPGPVAFKSLERSKFAFVGGTNMLSSHWLWYHQWKLHLKDLHRAGSPVLMGVGWHKYQEDPDFFTRKIYKRVLHKTLLHSVRDRYTFEKLRTNGIENVIYTGCPTMWSLTPEHMTTVRKEKSPNVVFALTAYLRNPDVDRRFVKLLADRYEKVYFWPQMYDDLEYLKEITDVPVEIIEPSVNGVRDVFLNNDVDYIGLRLHCGVLALQCKVRSLILVVDNRAAEISKNTRLPTVKRDDFDVIEKWIDEPAEITLDIPVDDIARWKAQFAD